MSRLPGPSRVLLPVRPTLSVTGPDSNAARPAPWIVCPAVVAALAGANSVRTALDAPEKSFVPSKAARVRVFVNEAPEEARAWPSAPATVTAAVWPTVADQALGSRFSSATDPTASAATDTVTLSSTPSNGSKPSKVRDETAPIGPWWRSVFVTWWRQKVTSQTAEY